MNDFELCQQQAFLKPACDAIAEMIDTEIIGRMLLGDQWDEFDNVEKQLLVDISLNG
jgi:hypothetical protein